jgi:hypothetical protein
MATEIVETPVIRPAPTLADVMKNAREKSVPMIPPETPVQAKPPEQKKPEETPKIDDTIAKELEATKAKLADTETKLAATAKDLEQLGALKEGRELWKAGKKIEAIQKLAAVEDVDAELDDVVTAWAQRPTKESKDEVTEKLDSLIKRLDDKDKAEEKRKEDETKQATEAKKAAVEQAKKDAADFAGSILDKNKENFDLCLRPKHKAEACEKVSPIALAILKRDGIDPVKMSREQAEKALVEAFSEIEKDLEKEGEENYVKRAKEAKPAETPVNDKPAVPRSKNAAIKVVQSSSHVTLEGVLAKARKAAKYGT